LRAERVHRAPALDDDRRGYFATGARSLAASKLSAIPIPDDQLTAVPPAAVAAALACCERARLPAGVRVVGRGRHLGAHVDGRSRPRPGLDVILREWGASGLIDDRQISAALA
jgi:hypothetical protein